MEEKQNNLLKAIGISLLVALVGAVLWGVIYIYGWFVGIIAYFTAILMIKMFNKYYQTDKKWKYFYVFGVIIVFNIVASFISLTRYLASYAEIGFGEAFALMFENISLYIGDFVIDMIIGCVCAIFGVVTAIRLDIREKQTREQEELLKREAEQQESQKAEIKASEDSGSNVSETNNSLANMLEKEDVKNQESSNVATEEDVKQEEITEKPHKAKFCSSCGAALEGDEKVCKHCGAEIEE